jgi:hypothetical protein
MDARQAVEQELAKISSTLSKALQSATPAEWQAIVERTINRIDAVIENLDKPRSKSGKKSEIF